MPRKAVDLMIGCVDNDGARLILTELAAAHLVPYLDIGVSIQRDARGSLQMGGRTAFYVAGGACLACADELDFGEATQDLESEAVRRIRLARSYAEDKQVQAALMPLNTLMAGWAMTEALVYLGGAQAGAVPALRLWSEPPDPDQPWSDPEPASR